MSIKIFSLIFCLYFVIIQASGQKVFTLSEAIDYALEHHLSMREAKLSGEDALWQFREARSIGMPQATLDVSYNYHYIRPKAVIEDFISPIIVGVLGQTSIADELSGFGGDTPRTVEAGFTRRHQMVVGLNTSVSVFDGNYLKGLKVGRMFIELAKKQIELTEQDIRSNVTRAYQNIIVAKETIGVLEKNISNITKLLFETQLFYENGFVEELDVDRLILSKENLENEKSKLFRLLDVSKNILKFQMAFPLLKEIDIDEDLEQEVEQIIIKSIDLKEEIDFEARPEHRLLMEALAMDDADLIRIKQGFLPSVFANLGLEQSLQRDKFFNGNESGFLPNGVFGLNAVVPIYDGQDTKSKIERKKIAMEKRRIEVDEFDRGLVLQIFNARSELINAKESLNSTIRALSLSEKIYDKTKIKYNSGVGSSLELSQSEADLYAAQANYINSLYDILVAQTNLDVATGEINNK
jgi:outer membrane protein TolC